MVASATPLDKSASTVIVNSLGAFKLDQMGHEMLPGSVTGEQREFQLWPTLGTTHVKRGPLRVLTRDRVTGQLGP